MKKLLTDSNISDSNDSYHDNLKTKSELNTTLKKCQSLMTLQKMMIIRADPNLTLAEIEKNISIEKKYNLDVDITNKNNSEFINKKIKHYFNMSNYEQNIKKEAWKKDLSKIYLGLNNDKDNKEGEYEEYNFERREKKKNDLMFLRNFFGQLKSVKKDKAYKLKDKSRENPLYLNRYEKYYFKDNDKKEINEEDLNLLLNKLKIKYSPEKQKDEYKTINIDKNNKKYLTEISNNTNFNYNDKIKTNNFKRRNLFNSHYHLNQITKRLKKDNQNNNNNNRYTLNDKNFFPKITNNYDINKNKSKTIVNEHRANRNGIKNIKVTISDKNIFDKNKNQQKFFKGINRNKTYLEKLKKIYKSDSNNKYRTININNINKINNFEMPKLLKYREKPLFKKNNQLFFSPMHYSKYEQMKEIRDKLIGIGFLDNEVFAVYNKNI